ncbi:hypothetical protein BP6252_01111 [Coleophoma cylindrospora]|uniref:Mid2 domain-containing protein n=1 Tax=Coleophoma cylindrospora TaxID=1849047 RepID=A0A3D8SRY3_9HELO|nr:hypothetical protein BP6252_01111 [Coleophoma cylindrospora]
MRLSQLSPRLLSLVTVLSHSSPALAGPYPKDDLHDLGFSYLMDRGCNIYCGSQNQYCCSSGEACYTNAANVAYCSSAGAATGWAVYTTTYTETDLILRTSTYSSYWGAATTTSSYASSATCTPDTSLGQTGCGAICCTNSQTCAYLGQCQDTGSVVLTTSYSYVASTTTATGSEAIRPTSGTAATNTVSVTTTEPFGTPASATSTSTGLAVTQNSTGGLSGGAIAGIVVGVIAGVILLLLFCFCCVLKAGFDGLLALLGLGSNKRRRSETRVTEERYSRHGSGTASRRDAHGGWFGGSRPARVTETRKKSSGLGGLGMVGAGLLGLAAILGLKRKSDTRKEKTTVVSDISSSYYTDSYTGTSDTQVQTGERENHADTDED